MGLSAIQWRPQGLHWASVYYFFLFFTFVTVRMAANARTEQFALLETYYIVARLVQRFERIESRDGRMPEPSIEGHVQYELEPEPKPGGMPH